MYGLWSGYVTSMVYNILHRIPPDNFSSIVTSFYRNFKLYYLQNISPYKLQYFAN